MVSCNFGRGFVYCPSPAGFGPVCSRIAPTKARFMPEDNPLFMRRRAASRCNRVTVCVTEMTLRGTRLARAAWGILAVLQRIAGGKLGAVALHGAEAANIKATSDTEGSNTITCRRGRAGRSRCPYRTPASGIAPRSSRRGQHKQWANDCGRPRMSRTVVRDAARAKNAVAT